MRTLVMLLTVLAMAALPAAASPSQKAASGSTRASSSKSPAAPSSPININTATQAQFESLPGIGPKVAQRIVEYRQKNGQFKKVEEILGTARSGADLLGIPPVGLPRPVSGRHRKSQQISRCLANGGRSGGRGCDPRGGGEAEARINNRKARPNGRRNAANDSAPCCAQVPIFKACCQRRWRLFLAGHSDRRTQSDNAEKNRMRDRSATAYRRGRGRHPVLWKCETRGGKKETVGGA